MIRPKPLLATLAVSGALLGGGAAIASAASASHTTTSSSGTTSTATTPSHGSAPAGRPGSGSRNCPNM
jgi:hypothetical protein